MKHLTIKKEYNGMVFNVHMEIHEDGDYQITFMELASIPQDLDISLELSREAVKRGVQDKDTIFGNSFKLVKELYDRV